MRTTARRHPGHENAEVRGMRGVKQEKHVPIKEARAVATSMAKKPEQPGTTTMIKRRVAKPRGDD